MTERALTKEQIFKTFQPQVVRREPRPDRVGKEGVPPFVDFVEFRDEQGRLRYAINKDYYEGPPVADGQAQVFDSERQSASTAIDSSLDSLITRRYEEVYGPEIKGPSHSKSRMFGPKPGTDSRDRGVRIQATQVSGRVREEGAPRIDATVAKSFLDLLKDVRQPLRADRTYVFRASPKFEKRITSILDAACAQIPGISRDSLDKIIRNDPFNYPEWPISVRRQGADADWSFVLDFPQLAANWGHREWEVNTATNEETEIPGMYEEMRQIAVRDYGVGVKELDFLQAVFEQEPPRIHIF